MSAKPEQASDQIQRCVRAACGRDARDPTSRGRPARQ